MAGPSSFVPSPVTPSRTARRFTLQQANRTLPLVGRMVRDIVAAQQKVTAGQNAQSKTGKNQKQNKSSERDADVDRLQGFVDELTSIGAELKDSQIGLIDFIGRHQGRDVYLCWKLGEETIGYWHELDAGFGGRRPVSQLDERE